MEIKCWSAGSAATSLPFLKQKRTSLDRRDSLNPAGAQIAVNRDVGGVLDVVWS